VNWQWQFTMSVLHWIWKILGKIVFEQFWIINILLFTKVHTCRIKQYNHSKIQSPLFSKLLIYLSHTYYKYCILALEGFSNVISFFSCLSETCSKYKYRQWRRQPKLYQQKPQVTQDCAYAVNNTWYLLRSALVFQLIHF